MEKLKCLLKELFKKTNHWYTKEELRKILNVKGEKQTEFFNMALQELIEEGCLFFNEKKGYTLFTNSLGYAYGNIEITKAGNGFIHTKDGYTIFIESANLNGALNGDTVIIKDIINGTRKEFKGTVDKVLKRKNGIAYFKVIGNGLTASLLPYNNNYNINIELNKNQRKNLIDGDIIEVTIDTEDDMGIYMASVQRSVGNISDPDSDLKVLASECEIATLFTEEELKQAENMPKEVTNDDMKDRVDLRNLSFLTIDCDNTKDRDDAVHVEKLANGNYKLYVSIASVNHYIKKGTPLYEGILRRCTSHYPNNTCIPMLPHTISNGICSLNEGVDRLTKTCEMEITPGGKMVNYSIYNSVINSKKAMKYSLVNDVLDYKEATEYKPFEEQLFTMQELSEILSKNAEKRKYLNFNIPEIEVKKDNEEFEFSLNNQGKAEKLIENFMVITDNTVAKEYGWLPFIFRTHDMPKEELVEQVVKKIKCAGIHVNLAGGIDPVAIRKILSILNSKEEYQVFNSILLKSMQKARYSTENYGHYALQLEEYCHFTSPIRRIADFMVHTIIDEAIESNYDLNYLNSLELDLNEISKDATKEEIKDKLFESEARKMAMAEYMENHIGEKYNAIITEVYPQGIFVRTSDLIEGKIALTDIGHDKSKYRYNPDIDAIVGNNNHIYHIGDYVEVESIDASKENRTVNFSLERKRKHIG